MTSDEWTWKFTTRAADQFDSLDPHVQDRIALRDIVVVHIGPTDVGHWSDAQL
jgi:hypothetical protein